MQQEISVYRRMVNGAGRLQAAVRRGGGVGVLAGLLLLPLGVGAVRSGDLDTGFGGDGMVTTRFGSGDTNDYASAVAIQPDGRMVVAGYSDAGGSYALSLARYLPNDTTGTFIAVFTPAVPQSIRPFAASPLAPMDICTRAVFSNRSPKWG